MAAMKPRTGDGPLEATAEGRTVQVRVPVMEWGFNSPLAHDETADPSGSAVFVFLAVCGQCAGYGD